MFRVDVHPNVYAELEHSPAWYEKRAENLGSEFLTMSLKATRKAYALDLPLVNTMNGLDNDGARKFGPIQSAFLIVVTCAIISMLVLFKKAPIINFMGNIASYFFFVLDKIIILGSIAAVLSAAWRFFTPKGFWITLLLTILALIGIFKLVIFL